MNGENFPLDDATIETLADLNSQIRGCQMAQEAVLQCFYKRNQLSGKWRLAPNGRELVKPEAEIMQGDTNA